MTQLLARGRDLAVMPADEAAVDLQVVVGGAADDEPALGTAGISARCARSVATRSLPEGRQRRGRSADARQRELRGGRICCVRAGSRTPPIAARRRHSRYPRWYDRYAVEVVGGHHCRVAQRVDEPRHAAREAEDLGEGVLGEDLAVACTGHLQAVLDVGPRLRLDSAVRWKRRRTRCASCTSSGASSLAFSSGWPARMMRSTFSLVVSTPESSRISSSTRQREVLRLVDDQQHLAAGGVLLDEEIVESRDELGLLHLEGREAELHQHRLQELDGRNLRLVDLRDDDVRSGFP